MNRLSLFVGKRWEIWWLCFWRCKLAKCTHCWNYWKLGSPICMLVLYEINVSISSDLISFFISKNINCSVRHSTDLLAVVKMHWRNSKGWYDLNTVVAVSGAKMKAFFLGKRFYRQKNYSNFLRKGVLCRHFRNGMASKFIFTAPRSVIIQ